MSRTRCDWSKLCHDVLGSILECLSTKDFHRARSVCSNWYSVSVSCMRPLYPWQILFNEEHSTYLFDPGEDKTHEIQHHHPEIDFSKTYVMDSCSNWLLMVDSRLDFFLFNVFTGERIKLPSLEPLLRGKEGRFERKQEWEDYIQRCKISFSKKSAAAVLWIDERTRDYVVAWSYKKHYLFSYKKGDDSWCNLGSHDCESMAYKDSKLYVYTSDHYIKILDLSGDLPNEIVEGNPYRSHRFGFVTQAGEFIWMKKVAITSSGEVLIVLSLKGLQEKLLFYVFKMNVEIGDWERVDSVGGEMLIFGHGVTVRAPIKEINGDGIKSDSICFLEDDLWPATHYLDLKRRTNHCGVFDLARSTVTCHTPLDVSFLKSFWFVPGYG